jgi:DNA-binding XRE family transcriptional regulator
MAPRKRNAHVSDLTLDDLVRARDAGEPGFQARVDARVADLALARKVRALREKRGLTQAELAERAGTGQAAIARIESGKATPKLDLLARIAVALGARLRVDFSPAGA